MPLLLDQNLSFKICKKISDIFPKSKHVSDIGLVGCIDLDIWQYAKTNNYTIVTFDSDFIDISLLKGFPPKIIWLRFGNSHTEFIVNKINTNYGIISDFISSSENAFLEINS